MRHEAKSEHLRFASQAAAGLSVLRPMNLARDLFVLYSAVILSITTRVEHLRGRKHLRALHVAHELRDPQYDRAKTTHFGNPVEHAELHSDKLVGSRIVFKGHRNLKRSVVNECARRLLLGFENRLGLLGEAEAKVTFVVFDLANFNLPREVDTSLLRYSVPADLSFIFEHLA